MAEVLFNKSIALADGGPAVVTDINIAQDVAGSWSVLAQPVDSGPANATSIVIERLFLGLPTALVGSTPLTDNVVNPFVRTEALTRIRVTLTPGVTAPDGGVKLQVVGSRR